MTSAVRPSHATATPELAKLDRQYRNMTIGGSVALGVGLVMLSTTGALRPSYIDENGDEIVEFNATSIIWGTLGLVGTVAGSVVLGVGASRRKALRNPIIQVQAAPYFGPNGGGAAASFKF